MPDRNNLLSQFYVKLNGQQVPEDFTRNLEHIIIETSLHLPDVATLTLFDPRLHWLDHASVAPGTSMQISAKSGSGEAPLFDGEIVELEPEFEPGAQRLRVRAFDRLHRLARGCHARSFLNVTDGDIVQKIASEVKLQAQVGPTTQVHPYVFQNNESNLSFLRRRAAALGYLLYVKGSKLHCEAPKADSDAVKLQWGSSLTEFRPRLTTIGQVNRINVRGWDPAMKREIVGQANKSKVEPDVGVESGGNIAQQAFRLEAQHLVADSSIRNQATADLLAQATADRMGGSFVEAEGLATGNPKLIAGARVQIDSVGERFSGTYFVTSASHTYNVEEGYRTRFSISGLNPASMLSLMADDQEPIPHNNLLVIGIVTDNQDPENLGRVKVKYPWLSAEHTSYWARVVSVGAGITRGVQFLPEVNDEVLVGFEQGNIHYPYVLGGLWNGRDKPPKPNSEIVQNGKVQQRIILSRTGHTIILDDKDGAGGITIKDRANNFIKLETAENALIIETQGNITVKTSGGNIAMEAQGNMSLKAQGSVDIEGSGPVNVKGAVINLN